MSLTRLRFKMSPIGAGPVLDIAPLSTRMVSAYQDRTGRTHVFSDILDHDRETTFDRVIDSFDAVIGCYSSSDLKTFTDHGIVLDKGRWTGRVGTSDHDCIGCASPGVVVVGDQVLLFHAGRGPCDPAGPFLRDTGLPQLPGQIMLATADADENGAPAGPFLKRGPVTDYDAPWRVTRHDDPCAVVDGDRIYLFYKGISFRGEDRKRVIGLAVGRVDDPAGPYEMVPDPVLVTDPDGETPRVFKLGDTWHMFFLRTQSRAARRGRVYEHYATDDPRRWTLVDDRVYESFSIIPGRGAPDMCPIWTPFEDGPPRLAFAVRMSEADGRLRQWLWRIEMTGA